MAERRNFVRPVLLYLSAGFGGQNFSFRRETHEKRFLALLLVLTMVFSLMPAALAADKPSFQSFFESVPANAETEPGSPNSTNKWKVASLDGDYVLKSGGAGKAKPTAPCS